MGFKPIDFFKSVISPGNNEVQGLSTRALLGGVALSGGLAWALGELVASRSRAGILSPVLRKQSFRDIAPAAAVIAVTEFFLYFALTKVIRDNDSKSSGTSDTPDLSDSGMPKQPEAGTVIDDHPNPKSATSENGPDNAVMGSLFSVPVDAIDATAGKGELAEDSSEQERQEEGMEQGSKDKDEKEAGGADEKEGKEEDKGEEEQVAVVEKVVLYTTTMRAVRKTFDDCMNARNLIQACGVWIDERDVSLHTEFRTELHGLIGGAAAVPQLFVGGRHLGGIAEIVELYETEELKPALSKALRRHQAKICEECGGARFVVCTTCDGSRKLQGNAGEDPEACPNCNEAGLQRCAACNAL